MDGPAHANVFVFLGSWFHSSSDCWTGSPVASLHIEFGRGGSWTQPRPLFSHDPLGVTFTTWHPHVPPLPPQPLHGRASYMYTFRMRSSFVSPVRRSAMLRTAQPKGLRYWVLQAFFFSPAPIRPVQWKSKYNPCSHSTCAPSADTETLTNGTGQWKGAGDVASVLDSPFQAPCCVTSGSSMKLWAPAITNETWRLELILCLGTLPQGFMKTTQEVWVDKCNNGAISFFYFWENFHT